MTYEEPRGLIRPLDEAFWHVMRELAVTKAELIDRLAAAPPEQRLAIRRALKQVRTIKSKHIGHYHRLFPLQWVEPPEPEK